MPVTDIPYLSNLSALLNDKISRLCNEIKVLGHTR